VDSVNLVFCDLVVSLYSLDLGSDAVIWRSEKQFPCLCAIEHRRQEPRSNDWVCFKSDTFEPGYSRI